ncbi:MAG: ribosome biogenesis GTPase Der, partial [Nitrospinota bacterium]
MARPVVAIIGRPNVGKSTLFNRMIGQRKAIVSEVPGLTRDRNYAEVSWQGTSFVLVDTGGWDPLARDDLVGRVREQTEHAIAEADVLIFLVDGKEGLTPLDLDIAALLRSVEKPVLLAVNKVDAPQHEERGYEFYQLGLEELFLISAMHGRGVGDLLDRITSLLHQDRPSRREEEEIKARIAVVGRPNAGKSSLINRLLGQERLLVHDAPGTTRDAIDTLVKVEGETFLFVDTAGIRRKSRIKEEIEEYSVRMAQRSISRCDLALLVIDATQGIVDQDVRIASYLERRGRGAILVLNKWDLVSKDETTTGVYIKEIRRRLGSLAYAPVLFVSALTGQRVSKIFPLIRQVMTEFRKRIPTAEVNAFFSEAW